MTLAKARPGQLAFASAGNAGIAHLSAEFANIIRQERDKWTKLIKAAHIKLEQ